MHSGVGEFFFSLTVVMVAFACCYDGELAGDDDVVVDDAS